MCHRADNPTRTLLAVPDRPCYAAPSHTVSAPEGPDEATAYKCAYKAGIRQGPLLGQKGPLTCTFMVVLTHLCLNVAPTPVRRTEEIEAPESSRYVAPPGPRRTRMTAELQAEVVARYQSGETSREVAEACGIAKSTVLRILKDADVKVRPRGVRY